MFKKVEPKVNFPEKEEEILSYWKKNGIFEKSVAERPLDKTWTFLDGPPFVTGLPHYGHLLTSIAKDLFPRYYTMKGYRVRRVWGWDGHGLPVENKVENKLGITRKKDIEEKIGIKKFIQECKKYVEQVSDEWEWYVEHIARWVDFEHSYKTWDTPYMESVMWVFKQMYDRGLVYKGLRVSLYCPHCSTPISNFEVAMDADNYKEIIDPAATYKYQIKDEPDTFILAWSTTPWNKLVTPALAVNPKLMYIKIEQNGEKYILAELTKKMLKKTPYKIIDRFKGTKLVGKKFVPHYNFYKIESGRKAFEIIPGDFVTAEEGTGVVTIAVYGEEDLVAMKEHNIQMVMHLDEEGVIKSEVPVFGGMYYLKANKYVNEDLEKRGLVYEEYKYPHNVPLCWRCHTRLYYAPQNAWFVDVQSLKEEMKMTNEKVNWIPGHFKHGRFLKSLENAPDWNISRNRYWGSPVPVWECKCGERFVPGSIKELEEASGRKVQDLHKPEIDDVTVICKKCNGLAKRTSEVLDSWIEAGSASFGERHYPFSNTEDLGSFYPPDFIVEYTGQIRAWFYVLHVISNALYKKQAFKNVLVNGVILGTDGRKMSKNYGNYPDPKLMLEQYGGDALRLYLMSSPVVQGEDTAISEEQYRNQVRGTLLILWNVYNFFVTYANIDGWSIKDMAKSEHVLDRWIESLLNQFVLDLTKHLDRYDTIRAIEKLDEFITKLSTWYIRRSRDRVGPQAASEKDKNAFYSTAYTVLTTLSKAAAPIIPFVTEEIYRNLTGEESVHLTDWPEADRKKVDSMLVEQMNDAISLVSAIHEFRKNSAVKVKIPLKKLIYNGPEKISDEILQVVKDEVNAYELSYGKKTKEFKVEGNTDTSNQDLVAGEVRDIIRKIQQERKILGTTFDEKVTVYLPTWPEEFENEIMKNALVEKLLKAEDFKVVRHDE